MALAVFAQLVRYQQPEATLYLAQLLQPEVAEAAHKAEPVVQVVLAVAVVVLLMQQIMQVELVRLHQFKEIMVVLESTLAQAAAALVQ